MTSQGTAVIEVLLGAFVFAEILSFIAGRRKKNQHNIVFKKIVIVLAVSVLMLMLFRWDAAKPKQDRWFLDPPNWIRK